MNILHTVEFYDPSVGGSQTVVKQLSERLAKMGHRITVATSKNPDRKQKLINGVHIREFEITGSYPQGYRGEIEKYQAFLLNENYDLIMNYAAQQWSTDLMLPIIKKISAKKVLVPCGFSGLHRKDFTSYFKRLPDCLNAYDALVFPTKSYQDYQYCKSLSLSHLHVIPNGFSPEEFSEDNRDRRSELGIPLYHTFLIHIGSHTGAKGHHELIQIFHKAHIKHATLVVIAKPYSGGCYHDCEKEIFWFNLHPMNIIRQKKVMMKHLSRDKTISALKSADVMIFPSQVECAPLVIYEALAAGIPFMATDVGNVADIIRETKAGVLIPTHKGQKGLKFADINKGSKLLASILTDYKSYVTNSEIARDYANSHFSWEKIAVHYERLYNRLITKLE